jgi:quinol monooxygenase YgiN
MSKRKDTMSNRSTAFVVIAEFEVLPNSKNEFLALCKFDAERSVTDEPGCQQFDANTSDKSQGTVVLYEVYDDRIAFDLHLTTPHYARFAEGVERLGVINTSVRFLRRQLP